MADYRASVAPTVIENIKHTARLIHSAQTALALRAIHNKAQYTNVNTPLILNILLLSMRAKPRYVLNTVAQR